MSRRAHMRSQAPRRGAINTMEIARTRAVRLSDADVMAQHRLIQQAVGEFCCGQHCAHHWRSLADTANMAETLAGMGLGAGTQADSVIEAAQATLHHVHQRHAQRGTWTLYADEIDSLQWLAALHLTQLQACSYGEFEAAYRRTADRMAQALAGNASPGTIVIVGEIDKRASATS